MKNNNELYWNIAMKFFDLEDGDVNKLKKDIDDQNSTLYQLAFAWYDLKYSEKVSGLYGFRTNFNRFFGLDSNTERKLWYRYIDEVTDRWSMTNRLNKRNGENY